MSATALAAAADSAQEGWDVAVRRVAARYAAEAARRDSVDEAYALLRQMLARETGTAAMHGAEAVARIVTAAGVEAVGRADYSVAPPADLYRTLTQAWRVAAAQADPPTARRAVAARIVDYSLTSAWREGTHAALVGEPSVVGWRRVSRAGCCGACLALADGSIRPLTERLEEHPFGRCFQEPTISGVNDVTWGRVTGLQRWEAMTADQQNEMFRGHGGAAKAGLIRAGAVSLDALVSRAPRVGVSLVYETPLAELLDAATA